MVAKTAIQVDDLRGKAVEDYCASSGCGIAKSRTNKEPSLQQLRQAATGLGKVLCSFLSLVDWRRCQRLASFMFGLVVDLSTPICFALGLPLRVRLDIRLRRALPLPRWIATAARGLVAITKPRNRLQYVSARWAFATPAICRDNGCSSNEEDQVNHFRRLDAVVRHCVPGIGANKTSEFLVHHVR